jgi:hypothetical protein
MVYVMAKFDVVGAKVNISLVNVVKLIPLNPIKLYVNMIWSVS